MARSVHLFLICLLLVAVVVTACSSLPPTKPATDLKAIAGKWEGWLTLPNGNRVPATSTIREDGTVETIVPALTNPGPRFVARVTVQDGKYRWKSETTGRTGVFTLHEGDGRRVLVGRPDDGSGSSEYTPAK
jgi:hypothetical protein